MAIRYYDEAIAEKLQNWLPDTRKLRVLKVDETKRLFETLANDGEDKNITLPLITLSRDRDIELKHRSKDITTYNGLKIVQSEEKTAVLNIIPIKVMYQIDIYTKTYEEGDEYVRNLLFKLINNPKIFITIPYHEAEIQHVAYLQMQSTVSDTSDISERIFSGQFTRWSIKLELVDGYLFNIPYRDNWSFKDIDLDYNFKGKNNSDDIDKSILK